MNHFYYVMNIYFMKVNLHTSTPAATDRGFEANQFRKEIRLR